MQPSSLVVLVVEDDPVTCEMLQTVLEQEYTVESAADGAAGLARIEAGGIDLVLLDLMLPEVDGLELCRRVRAREGEVYLPIIMLTALTAAEQRHTGFVAGADDYVTKPFDIDELLDRVRVWVGTRQRLKAAHEQLLHQQQELRELGERSLREALARDEAVLLMMRTPLKVLLNVLEAWEAAQPSPEDAARVRADLEGATSELTARMDALSQLLRGGDTATDFGVAHPGGGRRRPEGTAASSTPTPRGHSGSPFPARPPLGDRGDPAS